MPRIWEHSWAVMWPTPSGTWAMGRFNDEKQARGVWKQMRKDIPEVELVEQYIQRDKPGDII